MTRAGTSTTPCGWIPGFARRASSSAAARRASAGFAVTPASIQASLRGNGGRRGGGGRGGSDAATPMGGSLSGTLRLATDGLNGSVAQGATAGAISGAVAAAALPQAPIVDALAAAVGADQPINTGTLGVILQRPKLP